MQGKRTALHIACVEGQVDVAATLLKHGAKEDKVSLAGKMRNYIIAFNDVMFLCYHWLIHSLTVSPVKHGSCVLLQ